LPKNPKEASSLRVRSVIRLLLTYANFLKRSKADIEAAATVYAKAVELGPEHAKALAAYAHFLCEEGGQQYVEDALGLFSRALKAEPHNVVHALWYAKLLRRCGKVAQAGIMYDVAHKFSNGTGRKIEATAICNLATFFYKQRKDPDKAQNLFVEGLARFPRHKGLVKNYSVLLKAVPTLRDNEERLKRASSSNSLASAASSSTPLSKAMKALLVNTASPVGTPKGNARAKTPVAISKPSTPIDVLVGTKTIVLPPPNSRDRDAADFAALFHPTVRDDDEEEDGDLYDVPP
jgi:Tfp pilus assembly protein PilF